MFTHCLGRETKGVGKVCIRPKRPRASIGFCSMKRVGTLLVPRECDASSSLKGSPPAFNSPVPIYTLGSVKRDINVRVECLVRTPTVRSGDRTSSLMPSLLLVEGYELTEFVPRSTNCTKFPFFFCDFSNVRPKSLNETSRNVNMRRL